MKSKKLLVINLLALFAFVLVMGFGIYQANSGPENITQVHGDESDVEEESTERENDGDSLAIKEKVKKTPVELIKKQTVGSLAFSDKTRFFVAGKDVNEVGRELEGEVELNDNFDAEQEPNTVSKVNAKSTKEADTQTNDNSSSNDSTNVDKTGSKKNEKADNTKDNNSNNGNQKIDNDKEEVKEENNNSKENVENGQETSEEDLENENSAGDSESNEEEKVDPGVGLDLDAKG